MNHISWIKDENLGSISSSSSSNNFDVNFNPQPKEGLHGTSIPPFLSKTYDLVEDLNTNDVVSWGRCNNSFIVWNPQAFAMNILPMYFKHNNFSSFVRQLNTYGFRKVDAEKWEFANEGFLKGHKHLLKNITRRKNPIFNPQALNQATLDSCVEVGRFGFDSEIDRLRRDKQVLMAELVKLRQQQQATKSYLNVMEQRLKGTELKQQQTMSFLAKAIQNPNFLQQIVQHKNKNKELEEAINKKRRKKIDDATRSSDNNGVFGELIGQFGVEGHFGNVNYAKFEDHSVVGFDRDVEFMQGGSSMNLQQYDDQERLRRAEKSIDDGFWDDLMNDGLADQLGFFG